VQAGQVCIATCVGLVLHAFVIECATCGFRFAIGCLTLLVMNSLMTQVELKEEELASKLVCFGVNGVSAFQGFRFGITIQIQC